jgi:hypothetical protein
MYWQYLALEPLETRVDEALMFQTVVVIPLGSFGHEGVIIWR